MKKTTVADILKNILENYEVPNREDFVGEFEKFRHGDVVEVPLNGLTSEEWEEIPPQLTTSFLSMDTTITHFLFYITNMVSLHESRVNGRSWEDILHELLIDQKHPVKRYHRKGIEILVLSEVLCDYLTRIGVTYDHTTVEEEELFTPPLNMKEPFKDTRPLNSLFTTSEFSKYVRRLRVALQDGGTWDDLLDLPIKEHLPNKVSIRGEMVFTRILGVSSAIQTEFYLDSPLRLMKYPSMRKIAEKLGVSYVVLLAMFRLQKSGSLNTVVDGSFVFDSIIKTLSGELENITFMKGGIS